jgi:DNA-binding transcriptional MerR regulator
MNCPRCRTMSPTGAAFCPSCGNDLRAFQSVGSTSIPQIDVKEQMKRAKAAAPGGYYQDQSGFAVGSGPKSPVKKMIAVAVIVALVALGVFGVSNLRKTGKLDGSPILARKGKDADAVLKDTGSTDVFLGQKGKTENVLKDVATKEKGMPEDVHRWLEHLERTEKKRGRLAQQGLSRMMIIAQTAGMGVSLDGLKALASGDPDSPEPKLSKDEIAEASEQVKNDWAQLKQEFASFPPPPECVRIADPYSHAIDETGAMISDVLDALAIAQEGDTSTALNSLYGMQNASKSIDEFGRNTDSRVGDICDKYNVRKWFSISSDFGNSNVLGAFGQR